MIPAVTPKLILQTMTRTEAGKYYAKLRKTALKRIERLEKSKFANTQFAKAHPASYYKPMSEVKNEREMAYLISDVIKFLNSPLSTISGQSERVARGIESLRRHGYDKISEENFEEFGRFMEAARSKSVGRYFDSERAAELFQENENVEAEQILKEFETYEREQIKQRALARRNRKK